MTVKEVAEKLGVSTARIYKWIERGTNIGPEFKKGFRGEWHLDGRKLKGVSK